MPSQTCGPSRRPTRTLHSWPRRSRDVLLLDVGLRDQDSLRVAAALRKEHPDAKIIVMDLIPVNEDIVEFVNAGVSGFVLKDATFDEFVATIRSVAAGKRCCRRRWPNRSFPRLRGLLTGRNSSARWKTSA